MAIHFTSDELAKRRAAAIADMRQRGLDGLLMFRQESMYYLSGYDTFGYVFFQCLYLGSDDRMVLLTRAPDLLQAEHTSVIEDIRIWVDGPAAEPAQELKVLLAGLGAAGKKLGVEWDSYGLTARNGQRLSAAFDGFADLVDASDLVTRLRAVKSPAELAYVRAAAKLADAALDAAHAEIRPNAFEGDILAAMHSAIYRGGGDDPANEFIIGSGADALLCRYKTGRRHLSAEDQLTLEFAGAYRHYHAALMRTIGIGKIDPRLRNMHSAAQDALFAAEAALKPGHPIGQVFDAHAATLDARGYRHARMNACGYGMGTTYAPNWMDWPMFYAGNPVEAEPGMVFFIHIILFDADTGLAMSLGRSSIVGGRQAEALSAASLDLVVK
jgi:Xaa-Pro dipeptidase